jgi:hypothetical protein
MAEPEEWWPAQPLECGLNPRLFALIILNHPFNVDHFDRLWHHCKGKIKIKKKQKKHIQRTEELKERGKKNLHLLHGLFPFSFLSVFLFMLWFVFFFFLGGGKIFLTSFYFWGEDGIN